MSIVNWTSILPPSVEIVYENRCFGEVDPWLIESYLLLKVGDVHIQLVWDDVKNLFAVRFIYQPLRSYVGEQIDCSSAQEAADAVTFFANEFASDPDTMRVENSTKARWHSSRGYTRDFFWGLRMDALAQIRVGSALANETEFLLENYVSRDSQVKPGTTGWQTVDMSSMAPELHEIFPTRVLARNG